MLITIISIILLLFFASFFVSVKLSGFGDSKKSKKSSQDEGEIPPPSSGLARFEEIRFDFLRFSEFFLLNKRPYGISNPINNATGSINTESHAYEIGAFDSTESEACRLNCEDDMDCNAWEFGDNGNGVSQCSKYKILSPAAIESTGNNQIGYIFRPNDNWAVTDLSDLPRNKNFFKDIANMTILLGSKVSALNVKSQMIMATDNIKYCYDVTPVSSPSTSYLEARAAALEGLERACEFFLFSKNVNYPKKTELALGVVNLLINDTDEIVFGGSADLLTKRQEIISSITLAGLDIANMKYRSLLTAMSKYDADDSGYITKDEYRDMIKENNSYIFSINDAELTEKDIDEAECLGDADIDYYVNTFFSQYDKDNDGRVYASDLLEGIEGMLSLLTPPSACFAY